MDGDAGWRRIGDSEGRGWRRTRIGEGRRAVRDEKDTRGQA